MTILITGASGKIGTCIGRYLVGKKFNCILNSRKKIKQNLKKESFLRSSIESKKFFIPNNTETLIHLASDTKNILSKKKFFFKNYLNDKKIFNLVKKNKKIKRLIFFSTALVYSHSNNGAVDEKTKKFSYLSYVQNKLKSEKMFLKLKDIKVYILRVPGVLLKQNKDLNFISSIIKKLKKNYNLKIYNKENLFNNLILIEELNRLIHHLIKNDFKSGIILVGTRKPLKLKLIIARLIKYFKSKSPINWQEENKGYYLNIYNLINKYKFNSISTGLSLKKYVEK